MHFILLTFVIILLLLLLTLLNVENMKRNIAFLIFILLSILVISIIFALFIYIDVVTICTWVKDYSSRYYLLFKLKYTWFFRHSKFSLFLLIWTLHRDSISKTWGMKPTWPSWQGLVTMYYTQNKKKKMRNFKKK